MQQDGKSSKKPYGDLRAAARVIGLMVATFAVLLFILPTSIIQPIAAIAGGIILIRKGRWNLNKGAITIVAASIVLSGAYLAMTRPVSTGMVTRETTFMEIDAYLKEQGFNGAIFIARDGNILISKGYGYADRSWMIPVTPHTKFRIGSNTKQFTAMSLLMLQHRGRLNVQDKFCKYIPDCPDAWKEITIHQLLTHTSGIPDYISTFFWGDTTKDGIIEAMKNKPLDFKPCEKYSYSNTGYVLLGKVIEQASGMSYGEFLQGNIFVPLNMTNSGFNPDMNIGTVGYINGFFETIPFLFPECFAGCGIHSTVEDLYKWDQALYTERLIPGTLLDEMFTAHAPEPNSSYSYGYGMEVGETRRHRLARHGGQEVGFGSFFERFPDEKLVIILLSNEYPDFNSIMGYIHQKIFG